MGFFCLYFLGLGTSLTSVGFVLGHFGTIGTTAGASMLITSGEAPSEVTAPLVLTVSPSLDIVLRINRWVSLGNLSNTKLLTKSTKT